jgi:serine/threonine protein kinase/tetratricopeptide (TPR) repeat protein
MDDVVDRLNAALADRYRIDHEIGSGGMATVYLAEDLRHERKVAVKVLRPELGATLGAERFLHEIKLTARLNHPHILPVHDSGEADGFLFYVMPYVEGETLRQRLDRERQLPLDDAVRIAREVADALSFAHGLGVVHRDIKPENILLEAGHAVVADFGIARALTVAGGERLTETGMTVGTPAYMSPEQGFGEEGLDARTDIYALGCVLYEMLAGDVPFPGATGQAILARKAVEPVPSLRVVRDTVPLAVEGAVTKALAKVAADRFATAQEFADELTRASTAELAARDLRPVSRARSGRTVAGVTGVVLVAAAAWWLTTRAAGPTYESLAVLPLATFTQDPEQEYLVAGVHDALISELGQTGLAVIGRATMIQYQNTEKQIREIASELNVDAVVEGSVFWAGDSVRIDARLVDGATQDRVWSGSYEGDPRDVLDLYRGFARAIADKIRLTLTPQAEAYLASAHPVDPETYEAYLRGMSYVDKETPAAIDTGLTYLRDAVERNPADALAYAGLAEGYATLGHSFAATSDAWPLARAAALRAMTLDSTLAQAHAALAMFKLYSEWDWAGAEQEFVRANELNPSLPMNHYHYAWYLRLLGRVDEAIAEHKRAQELDPLDLRHTAWLGGLYWIAGDYEKAIAEVQKSLEVDPDYTRSLLVLGSVYADMGRYDEAIAAHERLFALTPLGAWPLGRTYALAGREDEARAIAAQSEAAPPTPIGAFGLAVLYTALGENDAAFRWLNYEHPFAWVPWVNSFPWFDPLRDDPRYQDLLRRMNLPE